ncbi:MAG: hypothetical protein DI535_04195 [Citrobacter freundii]|nr:MAG: hypothetical protein DI535_04195 [Citrobacter freundii]
MGIFSAQRAQQLLASLVIFFLSVNTSVHGQLTGIEKPQIFPPTPQTQLFEKYLNHQLTEYNGLPEINIPLYTVEIKGMKIPITLSYHAGGIKYKSYDGEIAAGWSIGAGGYRVSRTINGKPDELYPLYNASTAFGSPSLEHSAYLASIAFPWQDPEFNKIAAITNDLTMRDGEYDQFNYMLPSSAGQFMIADRSTRSIAMTNDRQDKILLDPGSGTFNLSNIKILDNAGFEFQAGGLQGSMELVEKSRSNPTLKTAWPVSKIVSPYNEVVDFTYAKYSVSMSTESYYTYKIIDATSYQAAAGTLPSMTTFRELPENEEQFRYFEDMFFIEKIQTEKEKVEFQRQANSNVLAKILVTNLLNAETLEVFFNYADVEGHRLLTGITVNGKTYGFTYYDPPADMADAYPDQWGFYKYPYTGNEYWGLFLHEEFKEHYFAESETMPSNNRSWVQIKDRLSQILPSFVDRESNSNPHYFSLKTITFPTGGTTTYEYEPNQYSKATIANPTGPTIQGAGQRVKKIISKAGPTETPVTTLFKYGPGENGNGKVDVDYLDNVKYNFFSDTWSYDITTHFYDVTQWWYTLQKIHTYSPKAMSGDIDLQPPVEYEVVTTYQLDALNNQTLGKTVSTYEVPAKYSLSTMQHPSGYPANNYWYNDLSARYVSYVGIGIKPILKKKEFFKDGNTTPVMKEEYTYETLGTPLLYGIKVKQRLFFNRYPVSMTSDMYAPLVSSITNGYFDYGSTSANLTGYRPLTHTVTNYDGATPLVSTTAYEYNAKGLVSKKSTNTSLGTLLTEEYAYPEASAGAVYGQMETKNIISPVIRTVAKNNGIETQRIHTNYTDNNAITTGLILPETVQRSFTGQSNLQTELTYQKYDTKGNLTQYVGRDGVVTAVIWGYSQKFPIATTAGAVVSDVFHTSFEDQEGNSTNGDARTGLKSRVGGYSKALTGLTNGNYKLSYWQKSGGTWTLQSNDIVVSSGTYTISLTGQLDEIRFYPKGAQMTTATYNPHKGMIGQTDANNRISTFEYDAYGRLSLIRDHDRNIVKKICYNYAGQPEDCGQTVFYNVAKSGTFTRNNCGTNGTGGSVTYTVAAGTYSSTVSQATADQLAQDAVNANGQAYSNSNGSCSWTNQAQSGTFTRNNCGTGYTGGAVTYTIAANTYSSSVSLADANQQAVNAVNAGGQAYANANGTCTSTCNTGNCSGAGKKCVNGVCETGVQIQISCEYDETLHKYRRGYVYQYSDYSWSNPWYTYSPEACPID